MKCLCRTTIIVGWFAAVFLTFAYAYEKNPRDDREIRQGYDRDERWLGAAFAGAFWPVYWSGTLALKVVRAAKSSSALMCKDTTGNVWAPTADGICIVKANP